MGSRFGFLPVFPCYVPCGKWGTWVTGVAQFSALVLGEGTSSEREVEYRAVFPHLPGEGC